MTTTTSTTISSVVLDADDPAAAQAFYAALGVADRISVRAAQEPSTGFRGYTLSIVAAQPNDVDAFVDTSLSAGATVVTPVKKSLWGYGGVVQAPDGAIWKVAGADPTGMGSHRITIVSDGGAFTDPDGFVWDALDSASREP